MIVNVALVPEALAELSADRLARAALGAQSRLVEALLAHSTLVFASAGEISDFLSFLKNSSTFRDDERKRWNEVAIALYRQGRLVNLETQTARKLKDVDLLDDLADFLSLQDENVLVLPEPQFDKLFSAEQTIAVIDSSNSAVIASTLAEAGSLKKHRDQAELGSHPVGYSREAIGASLVQPLAQRSKEIAIFDRYLFGRLAIRDQQRNNRQQPEHLVWLLDALNAASPLGTRLKLYGGFGDTPLVPATAQEVIALVSRHWQSNPGNIVELEVHLANWSTERRLPHGRHIRFGSLGFSLDEGFDRLREPSLWDEHGFHWKYMWLESSVQGLKDDEAHVANATTTTTERFRI